MSPANSLAIAQADQTAVAINLDLAAAGARLVDAERERALKRSYLKHLRLIYRDSHNVDDRRWLRAEIAAMEDECLDRAATIGGRCSGDAPSRVTGGCAS